MFEHGMGKVGLITGQYNEQQVVVLWNVTPCTLLDVCKYFEEAVSLRLDAVLPKIWMQYFF